MKLLYFKLFVLAVIFNTTAQKINVLNKVIDIKGMKTLFLNVQNIPLDVYESKDDNIYIDFKMSLVGFSNEQKDSIKGLFLLEHSFNDDMLDLKIHADTFFSKSKKVGKKRINPNMEKFSIRAFEIHKSKKEFKTFAQINKDFETQKRILKNVYKTDIPINPNDVKTYSCNFILKLPKKLLLKMDSSDCQLVFHQKEIKNATLFINGGNLKMNSLLSSKLHRVNGQLFINKVKDSQLDFMSNIVNNIILDIETTSIKSDDCSFQIGRVGKSVSINDFNSKFFIYSFSRNFKDFQFNADYSTIYLFEPKKYDYQLDCFGYETLFNLKEHFKKSSVVSVKPNSLQSNLTMNNKLFEIRRKNNGKPFAGKMLFKTKNAIFNLKKRP